MSLSDTAMKFAEPTPYFIGVRSCEAGSFELNHYKPSLAFDKSDAKGRERGEGIVAKTSPDRLSCGERQVEGQNAKPCERQGSSGPQSAVITVLEATE